MDKQAVGFSQKLIVLPPRLLEESKVERIMTREEESLSQRERLSAPQGQRQSLLTCDALGHDVRHLTTGGQHPHAQLIDHQHLETERTAHRLYGICYDSLIRLWGQSSKRAPEMQNTVDS